MNVYPLFDSTIQPRKVLTIRLKNINKSVIDNLSRKIPIFQKFINGFTRSNMSSYLATSDPKNVAGRCRTEGHYNFRNSPSCT